MPCLRILATCSSRQPEPRRVRNALWFNAAAIPRPPIGPKSPNPAFASLTEGIIRRWTSINRLLHYQFQ